MSPCLQGRRRRGGRGGGGGVLTPALLKTGSVDPPDSRMKWPKSGAFPIFRVFWGRLATLPTIRPPPPTQKSVATPLHVSGCVVCPGVPASLCLSVPASRRPCVSVSRFPGVLMSRCPGVSASSRPGVSGQVPRGTQQAGRHTQQPINRAGLGRRPSPAVDRSAVPGAWPTRPARPAWRHGAATPSLHRTDRPAGMCGLPAQGNGLISIARPRDMVIWLVTGRTGQVIVRCSGQITGQVRSLVRSCHCQIKSIVRSLIRPLSCRSGDQVTRSGQLPVDGLCSVQSTARH